ncbi:MAG: hypothetical protein RL481_267, partial [Pseudomonadota bacterium]
VVAANGAGLVDYYAYDLLGQQIKHWNNYLGAYDVETTDYDIQGRVISQRGFGGDVTTISYAWENVQTNIGGTLITLGGWLQTTWMANGLYSHERTDLFGRVTWKRDLGGYTTDYGYDVAGRMAWSSSNGMQVSFAWFNSGLQASVVSGNSNAGTVNTNWTRDTATYSYNITGSRLTEYLVRETATYTPAYTYWYNQYEPEYVPESYYVSSAVIKNQTATYDALGRMKTWGEAGTATAPASNTTTSYDAAGNIRRTLANFYSLDANGNASAASTKDYWFRYDSLNRVVTNQGKLENGVIVRGAGSYGVSAGQDILYDASGQRAAVISSTLSYYGGYYGYGGTATTTDTRENYYYDAAGRLSSTYVAPDATSTGTIRTSISYDLMGRMSGQTDYEAGVAVYNRTAYYNSKGQLYYDAAWTKKDDNKTYSSTNYYYFTDYNNSQYMLGSVGWMQSTSSVSGTSGSTTSRTVNSYIWRDGAVQSGIQHTPNTSQSLTYNTTFYLNQFGQLTGAYIADGKARSVSYVLDELGQIIRRDETRPGNAPSGQVGSPHEVWYRFSGRQLGYTGNNGTSEVNFDASINERQTVAPTNAGTYRNGQLSGTTYADFAQNYDPINSYYQGAAGGTYRVQAGDSLQNIAQQLYGDSSLWYKIAEANGLSASAALVEGQTLVLPTGVTKSKNNAGTFKPYNAAEATGDLSPTQAKPPKKPKCGVFGQILLAVIAVAVAVILPGGGTVIGAAINGAIGSVVSQAVGVATGIQEKFSFKAVAMAAIGAGVGSALKGLEVFSKLGNVTKFANDVVRGALGSAITQGVGVATGLQDKFSWAGVAAAGIGAGIGGAVGRSIDGKSFLGQTISKGDFGYTMATATASGIANAATRSAINGESFGANLIAAIPDIVGQALGGALGGAVQGMMNGGAQELADALASGVIPTEDAERLSGLAKKYGVERIFAALVSGGDGNDGKFGFETTTDQQRKGAEKAKADYLARGKGKEAAEAAYYDVARLIYLKEQVQSAGAGAQSAGFRKFERAFNLALLAKDVYFSTSISELLPRGFSVYSNSIQGLSASSSNGYFSRVYRGGDTVYLVNRGTDDTGAGPFGRTPDGRTNATNLAGGLSGQHELAGDNAVALVAHAKRAKLGVHFVGHSLGGSLASLQAVVTGKSATTFNATNLEVDTVERYINRGNLKYRTIYAGKGGAKEVLIISDRAKQLYGRTNELIDYYYVDGDVARLQRGVGATQVGSPTKLSHDRFPVGLAKTVHGKGASADTQRARVVYERHLPTAHSMNSIIYSLFTRVSAN